MQISFTLESYEQVMDRENESIVRSDYFLLVQVTTTLLPLTLNAALHLKLGPVYRPLRDYVTPGACGR